MSRRAHSQYRAGLTLLEMAVGLASSVILVAGLASSLYIASQALPSATDGSSEAYRATCVVRDLVSDVNLALSIQERTNRAITITVPDRNGDKSPETIRYAWSGIAGDPLTYQFNGETAVTIATNVQSFHLEALTRLLEAKAVSALEPEDVAYEEFTEAKASGNVTSLSIGKPSGTTTGNLLVAAVALDGNAVSSLTTTGWTQMHKGPVSGTIAHSFGVWWKIASNAEPANYTFSWSGGRQAYGWVMRFSGNDLTNPINATATAQGGAIATVPSPAVTTTKPNTMIVRVGGFDGSRVTTDAPGLPLHTPITADRSSTTTTACSGAAGYIKQSAAGTSGSSAFVLVAPGGAYVTVTFAIAPVEQN